MKISDEIVQEFGSLLPFKATQGLKYSEIEKALSAVLPKLMVKVKPLEWDEYGDSFISGEYRVRENKDSDKEKFPVVLSMSEDFLGVFVNESSAIECAQADYERRMLEGLEIVKDDVDVAAVREGDEAELLKRLIKWDKDYPVNCWNGYAGLKELDRIIADASAALSAEPALKGQ